MALVVVLLVAVSPVMLAIDAVSVLTMPVVKFASPEKSDVVVAAVMVAFVAIIPFVDATESEKVPP